MSCEKDSCATSFTPKSDSRLYILEIASDLSSELIIKILFSLLFDKRKNTHHPKKVDYPKSLFFHFYILGPLLYSLIWFVACHLQEYLEIEFVLSFLFGPAPKRPLLEFLQYF